MSTQDKKADFAAKNGNSQTKQLFAKLSAMFEPAAKEAGKTLRPFSIATFTAMQCAGIAVGSSAFADLDETTRMEQLAALLVIQTTPLSELKRPLRDAAGDFKKFYWEFVFERADFSLETLAEQQEQLEDNLPAVEAAHIEVEAPAGDGGKSERAPGN